MLRRDLVKLSLLTLATSAAPGSLAALTATQVPPNFPTAKLLSVNDISLATYEMGTGIPVIFCHGFPELAYSWRSQMSAVAAAGFRAIAVDLRGFGQSSHPAEIADYAVTHVCDDLAAMMDALGLDEAIFCGHDWGNFVIDCMNLLYPEKVKGMISIGAGHVFRPEKLPAHRPEFTAVIDKQAYNDFMQQAEIPEQLLNNNAEALFRALYRKDYFSRSQLQSLPDNSPLRKVDLSVMIEQSRDSKDLFIDESTLRHYVMEFQRTGFDGGINWYRAMETSWNNLFQRPLNWEVKVPYLHLWPEDDPINPEGMDLGLDDYIRDLEQHRIANAGHFVLEQTPSAINQHLVNWLSRKFPHS